jgi:hypothetical protein
MMAVYITLWNAFYLSDRLRVGNEGQIKPPVNTTSESKCGFWGQASFLGTDPEAERIVR